jgi:hypothetical protein
VINSDRVIVLIDDVTVEHGNNLLAVVLPVAISGAEDGPARSKLAMMMGQ